MDVHLLIPAAYLMLKALVKKDIDEDAANREAAEQTGHRHFGYVDMVSFKIIVYSTEFRVSNSLYVYNVPINCY